MPLNPKHLTTGIENGRFNVLCYELLCSDRNRTDNFPAFFLQLINPLLNVRADMFERVRNRHHLPARGNPVRSIFVVGDPLAVDHIELA